MALSGVRSSWLMLARNCDLCWLASASWRLLSCISSNSRTFSMAIAAWSAKVEMSSICLSLNGRTVWRIRARTPIAVPSRSIGTATMVRKLPNAGPANVYSGSAHIRDVNHRALQQCAPGRGPAGERNRMLLHELNKFAGVLVAGGKPQQIAVGPRNRTHIRLAKPGSRLDQRVKYCLQVERRAADHLEHVGGGGLLL